MNKKKWNTKYGQQNLGKFWMCQTVFFENYRISRFVKDEMSSSKIAHIFCKNNIVLIEQQSIMSIYFVTLRHRLRAHKREVKKGERKRKDKYINKPNWKETEFIQWILSTYVACYDEMKQCTTVTQITKEHYSHLVTGKEAEGVLYVGPNIVTTGQLYWELQLDCRQLVPAYRPHNLKKK
jgi:hypothetical protein